MNETLLLKMISVFLDYFAVNVAARVTNVPLVSIVFGPTAVTVLVG